MNQGNEINWNELVSRAIEHDQLAITELYNHTYQQGYAIAYPIVLDAYEAEDVLQDAFVTAFRKLDTLESPEKFKAWFKVIVKNRCIDYLRKHKHVVFSDITIADNIEFEDTLPNDNLDFMPDEKMEQKEVSRLVQEILKGLSAEQRTCITMFYYEQMSIAEIAEFLQCSENTVKSRLNQSKKKIEKEVEALRKKGTKLYSFAPLPFFLWLLYQMEQKVPVPPVSAPIVEAAGSRGKPMGTTAAKSVLKSGVRASTMRLVAGALGVGVAAAASIGLIGRLSTPADALTTEYGVYEESGGEEETPSESATGTQESSTEVQSSETASSEETTPESTTEAEHETETTREESTAESTEGTTEPETEISTTEGTTEETPEPSTEEMTTETEPTQEVTEEPTTEAETTEEATTEEETTAPVIVVTKGSIENPYAMGETISITEDMFIDSYGGVTSEPFQVTMTVLDSYTYDEAASLMGGAIPEDGSAPVIKARVRFTGNYAGALETPPFLLSVMGTAGSSSVYNVYDESLNMVTSMYAGNDYTIYFFGHFVNGTNTIQRYDYAEIGYVVSGGAWKYLYVAI